MMWRARVGVNNKLSIIFYVSWLLLAAACFYFSISEALFAWLAGDEFILYQTYNNTGWLFSCTKYYYLNTTVNRISADFVGCLMAKNATMFSTPYLGWVCSRLIVYICIPIALSFFLKEIFKIPFKFSLIIALFLSAIVFFVLSNTGWYMYGFDLAIYGTATITFLILSALFPKSVENNHYFIAFCIFYAFNLMSHEGFLVVSGFYILLYGWYHYSFHNRLEKIKKSFPLMVKTVLSNHNSSINNIIADNYLRNTGDKRKLPAILDSIYDPKVPNSIAVRQKQWMDDIYSLYKVFPPEPCISVGSTKNTNGYCYHTYDVTNISKLLAHKKISNPTRIDFNETQNMEIKTPTDNCMVVVDKPTKGEHFIVSNTLSLNKGLNYLIFETKPTTSQLYLYIMGEKRNLFLPWLNSFSTSGTWGLFDNNNTLQPLFSQIENSPNMDKLKVIIYSDMPQKIHLRWQHGFMDKTFFKGFKRDTSSICKAEYGQIM